jgi:CheY-like chemotaxis protein
VSRVFLVHWHQGEARERAAKLEAMGHEVAVHCSRMQGGDSSGPKAIAAEPPDAVIVDLSRLPSHGMAVATWLRGRKGTRAIPLVFVPGDAAKTAQVRAAFPDATFAPWPRLRATLAKAIARPVRDPVVPAPAGYSGTPLPKKLGIKEQSRVVLVRPPQDFAATLGALPAGAEVAERLGGAVDVILLFCRALRELQQDFPRARQALAERGGLWACWPKKASGVLTDLDENAVRAVGLGHGLVDVKVCAVDATWSGLRFAHRRAK